MAAGVSNFGPFSQIGDPELGQICLLRQSRFDSVFGSFLDRFWIVFHGFRNVLFRFLGVVDVAFIVGVIVVVLSSSSSSPTLKSSPNAEYEI